LPEDWKIPDSFSFPGFNNSNPFPIQSNINDVFGSGIPEINMFSPKTLDEHSGDVFSDAQSETSSTEAYTSSYFSNSDTISTLSGSNSSSSGLESAAESLETDSEAVSTAEEAGALTESGLSGGLLAIPLLAENYLSSREIAVGQAQNQQQFISDKLGGSSAGYSFMAGPQAEANLAYRNMTTTLESGFAGSLVPGLSSILPNSAPDLQVMTNEGTTISDSQIL